MKKFYNLGARLAKSMVEILIPMISGLAHDMTSNSVFFFFTNLIPSILVITPEDCSELVPSSLGLWGLIYISQNQHNLVWSSVSCILNRADAFSRP